MKKKWLLFLLVLLLGLCASLFTFFYQEAKREAIRNINIQQSLHSQQAAQGIQDFFALWKGILTSLAESRHIIDLDRTGKESIGSFYQAHHEQIRAISRVDAAGRIVYTIPHDPKSIGRDISSQAHVREVMRTHKPTVSDVFPAIQGYNSVALHVPVFEGGIYRGTIAVSLDFQSLARRHLEGIRIGKTGYAWVISRDGTELYCPVPGHTGKSVFETSKDFPSILAMAAEMLKRKQGVTTYNFDQIGKETVDTVRKHASYMPISLGNTFWSIVVASSEEEVLDSLEAFRNRLILVIVLFLLGAALFSYYSLKARFIIQEEAKRLKAETELKESEARFRSLIEHAPEAIYVHVEEKFIYMNQMAANLFGAKEPGQLIGSSLLEQLPPSLHEAARERLRILYEEQRSVPIVEQFFTRPDGTEIQAEVNSVPIPYGDRNAGLTFARDITERRRMDQALRESEETFRKAFYTSPDSININRLSDGLYVSVNEGFTRVTGYSEAETIGRTSVELNIWVNPEDRRKLADGLKNEGVVRNLDAAFRMKNGEIRYGLMSAAVIELKGVPHILSIARDITDRKREEERLKESAEFISAIFEHVQSGIFLIDSGSHTIVNANRMATEMCGVTKEQMIGKACHRYICPAAACNCPITDCGQSIDRSERILLTTDGREIPVLKTAVPIRIAEKDYLLESFIDITESKRLASQLLQAQKMEAIGTLAGGIAHDFNNMLMGIQGIASLMMLDSDPSQPQYERLKLIEEQVRSGADLTRQLLGFARGGRYEVKPININEIIRKSSSMFGRTRKEIAIHRKYENEIWTVEGDQGQMEQAFLNLYVNAWQAMPGGGTIYLETQNVVLDGCDLPDLNPPGRYVKISVSDTGMGMDEKTRDRIFDPFFTTKGIGRGTGLGLAMVYGIVKGHGGMIHVYSESGLGTTFNIHLPASDKPVLEEKALPGKVFRGTGTILLVDDEKMVLDVSREMLESLGYRVFAAGSGQEAIAVFLEKRGSIDLVILDMIMPGISGGETFDRLRDFDPEIAVLFCSGYSVNDRVQEILDRGCRGFLQKPFSLEILSKKIREVLNG